jgi:hypothetical protein
MPPFVTAQEFSEALQLVGRPGGNQLEFLRAHARAKSRAATFRQLAVAAKYQSYRAINLHYGKLARRIGNALGQPTARITLLLESHQPDSVTNREWILVMRPEFAEALKAAGWI